MPQIRSNLAGRAFSAFVLGAAFGLLLHHDHVVQKLRGKDAFLAERSTYYDRFVLHQHTLPAFMLEFVVVAAVVWLLFEGLALLIALLFASVRKDTSSIPEGRLL